MRFPLAALVLATLGVAMRLTSQSAPTVATVNVDTSSPGTRIPDDFLGFSFETGSLASAGGFPAESAVFQRMVSQVGPVVLRFGGNSVDKTGWQRGPRTASTPSTVLTSSDADRVFAFARATGSPVLFSLNLGSSTPDVAADEADYVQSTGSDALLGFEIGNEPDLYKSNGLRTSAYSVTDYLGEWGSFADAVQAKVPAAILTGPADAGSVAAWTQPFAGRFGSRIALLTQHLYPTGPISAVGASASNAATIPNLLSAATRTRTDSEAAMLQQIAQSAGAPWRMAETNSCYNGGQTGVSNAFASALWGMDYMFTLAARGASGVNFHGGGSGAYTPIAVSGAQFSARPLYYAMLLFRAAARGRMIPATVAAAGVNLTSYAVLDDDGTLRVTVINKDAVQDAAIRVTPGADYTQATALRLSAPSLDATAGVTLGAAEAQADGSWSPSQIENVTGAGGVFATTAPAGSAIVFSFGGGTLAAANAASGQPLIAPGSIASVYGRSLGFVARQAPGDLPQSLAGVQVTLTDAAGVSRAAQIGYAAPSQVNFIVPSSVAAGAATVSVNGATGTVQVAGVAPGLFTMNGTSVAAALAVRVNGSNQQPLPVFDCGSGTCRTVPIPLDSASTVYVSLYGTGFGGASGGSVSCTIGGISAPVQSAGPQGQYPGLDQVNVAIPALLRGAGDVDVVVGVNGRASNAVRLNIGG